MLAVKAFYENGSIQWVDKPPVERAEILVVFPAESSLEKPTRKKYPQNGTTNILDKYRGCIKNPDFDYEQERDERLYEKYGSSN